MNYGQDVLLPGAMGESFEPLTKKRRMDIQGEQEVKLEHHPSTSKIQGASNGNVTTSHVIIMKSQKAHMNIQTLLLLQK